MYKILLVDDEMPALRLLQAIIDKHAPDFTAVQSCTCAEAALVYLKANKVDLLLTDISMPGKDGISLAMQARTMYPDIHIIIVSGYAEFDYAKGAIKASVDEYILKPVSIIQMTEVLSKIKIKLDEKASEREPAVLSAFLSRQPYDESLIAKLYGTKHYYFALIRWGNLPSTLGSIHYTSVIPSIDMPFTALYGRDDNEQILLMKADQTASEFQSAVKVYITQRKSSTWTIVFSRTGSSFLSLPDFFENASQLMERTVVIGWRQFVFLSSSMQSVDPPRIAGTTQKRLAVFIHDSNTKMIKDIFISLAVDWEKRQLPQLYATSMVQQLVYLVFSEKPALGKQQDVILRTVNELIRDAESYGDLMAGLYSVLFDDSALKDKKLTAEDLYSYAVRYIQEKYDQPISMQHVCAEVGISQTYLSRLFRKYGNISFSAYLTQYRMSNAMDLIREHPDMPLRNVAACVGYDDYAYFSKVFHQTLGCSPSQWSAKQNKG